MIQMLTLFGRIQLYEDVIMYQSTKNIAKHCLKLCSRLMPDITTIAVYTSTEASEKDRIVFNKTFEDIKEQLMYSLKISTLPEEYSTSSIKKIWDTTLHTMDFSPEDYKKENYVDGMSNDFSCNYLLYLKNYNKMMYSFAGQEVSSKIL